mmetsp:Transcript_30298/g.28939  ORF Transcript_30298/g.28939 Transcript_30298/m.28939 type:complete len:679 (-) Transcript_30298:8-2044(-)
MLDYNLNVLLLFIMLLNCISVLKCSSVQSSYVESSEVISGFVKIGSNTMRIIKRINSPSVCRTIQFINIPINTKSPLINGATFTLITDRLYNDRSAWTNGGAYLFFVNPTSDAPYGTWMVSSIPGEDSGYAYLKPSHESLIPIDDEAEWYWLESTGWLSNPEIKLQCLDTISIETHFYLVEYFENNQMYTSFYSPPVFSYSVTINEEFSSKLFPSLLKGSLWNTIDKEWEILEENTFQVICKLGAALVISDLQGRSTRAVLTQHEHSDHGWVLMFRRMPLTAIEEESSGWNSEQEIIVRLDSEGLEEGFELRKLSTEEKMEYTSEKRLIMKNIQKGEYVQVWYSLSGHKGTEGTEGAEVVEAEGVETDRSCVTKDGKCFSRSVKRPLVEEEIQVLLECVGLTDSKVVFKYHLNDRRDAMAQSILSKETEFFIIHIDDGDSLSMKDHRGRDIQLSAVFFIGKNVLDYIRQYLEYKEKSASGLSGCFLYHAGVTLPQSLIYAAEIVCVLIGYKPVTLIQFTTPTDHQWKFPFVSELAHSIVKAKLLLGSSLDIGYEIYSYREDKSLILYRLNRTYVADSLIPSRMSQALHPLPYPGEENPRADWQNQIYYAWWNGYMLGYPERFIDSYCEDFHNDLSLQEKLIQINRAKKDCKEYLLKIDKPVAEIRMGLEPPVSDDVWA